MADVPLLHEILNVGLFAGAQRPLALLTSNPKGGSASSRKATGEYYWPEFPEPVKVIEIPDGSTFLDEMTSILKREQPDSVFMVPPLGSRDRVPVTFRRTYPGLELHEIALQVAKENAPPECKVGAWIPRGFFVNASSQALRVQFAQETAPRLIVEFDPQEGAIPALLQLLVFDSGSSADTLVRFFRVPEAPARGLSNERQTALIEDLRRLITKQGGTTEFGYVLREGLPTESVWLYHRHHPSYRKRIEDLQHFGGVRSLGELVNIRIGFHNSQMVNALIPSHETERGIPVLEGREIGNKGNLTGNEPRFRMLEESAGPYLLQAGDICLRSMLTSDGHLNAVLIGEEMLPLVVNNSVVVLRPKPEVNLDREFLTAYLQSDHIVHSLRAQGIAHRLYTRSLEDVQVPVQDEELAAVMQDLRRAAQTMGDWQEEAKVAMRSLFDFESARDARTYLLASGRRVRQRERAAHQVDDLSYRLRTGLPHPLAYRWRAAETAALNLEGYKDVLDCAESATCYLAMVALTLMRAVEEPVHWLDTLVPRISDADRRSGTNFGDWVAIVRETNERRSLKEQVSAPFYQVARFLDDETVNKALSLLKERRDDESHGRGPRGAELASSLEECRDALAAFFEGIEFLSEYSLRYIEETNRNSLSGVTRYLYRDLMGDHPLVSAIEGETTTAELERQSLYLTDRTGEMFLLRPYLVRAQCPDCSGWENFYLDRYEARSGKCTLKSLEKGHTFEDDGIAAVFRQVGLLR